MAIEINFKKLDVATSKILRQFFLEQMNLGLKFWSKDDRHFLKDGTEIRFKNDLIARESKMGKEGLRYESISNKKPLGEGGYASVRKIKHTVTLGENEILPKKYGKNARRRVVKIQEHSQRNNLIHLQNEFNLTSRAEHLHIKVPTKASELEDTTSFTVMKLAPGKEAYDIINEDRNKTPLTTRQRFEISLALLQAVQEQVTSKGIIHRDLKPDNIFIDLGMPIQVNIIDYGLAMDENEIEEKTRGTTTFLAPELLDDPLSASFKADVFSAARILFLIWGGLNDTYDQELYADCSDVYDLTLTQRMENLFEGIKDLSYGGQALISSNLMEMLESQPEYRCSLEDAIELFSSLADNMDTHIVDPLTNFEFIAEKTLAIEMKKSSKPLKQSNSFFMSYDNFSENSCDESNEYSNEESEESSEKLQFECC
ncbi:MAG: protein kinase [Tatlockia sp.]|nr:protein kinase [Tatlockia sp.]